jgi:hypothetical protein
VRSVRRSSERFWISCCSAAAPIYVMHGCALVPRDDQCVETLGHGLQILHEIATGMTIASISYMTRRLGYGFKQSAHTYLIIRGIHIAFRASESSQLRYAKVDEELNNHS